MVNGGNPLLPFLARQAFVVFVEKYTEKSAPQLLYPSANFGFQPLHSYKPETDITNKRMNTYKTSMQLEGSNLELTF